MGDAGGEFTNRCELAGLLDLLLMRFLEFARGVLEALHHRVEPPGKFANFIPGLGGSASVEVACLDTAHLFEHVADGLRDQPHNEQPQYDTDQYEDYDPIHDKQIAVVGDTGLGGYE